MMAGIYYGAMYGGSTTSILLNLPGEAASVVTCIDGSPECQEGAGRGRPWDRRDRIVHRGTVAVVGLTSSRRRSPNSPSISVPRNISPYTTLGLLLAVDLSGRLDHQGADHPLRRPRLAMVGLDPISGKIRFTFGSIGLQGGLTS